MAVDFAPFCCWTLLDRAVKRPYHGVRMTTPHSTLLALFALATFGCTPNADQGQRLQQLEQRVAALETGRVAASSSTSLVPVKPQVQVTGLPSIVSVAIDAFATEPVISKHCSEKHHDNFDMQAYCIKKQREGVLKLQAPFPSDIPTAAKETILNQCTKKHPSDFDMREYCQKQQIAGYREINR
jgi:hypothetical protein